MPYSLAIFDFDGTLADSFPFFVAAHNTLALKHGFRALGADEIEALRGHPAREVMRHVGLPTWKLPLVAHDFIAMMQEQSANIRPFAGIPDALQQLAANGLKLAIVTSNARENVERILGAQTMRHISDAECGASLFGKRRRLERMLQRLRIAPAQAIYVGDQETDAAAAHEAKIAFGAVAWGYGALSSFAQFTLADTFMAVEDLRRLAC